MPPQRRARYSDGKFSVRQLMAADQIFSRVFDRARISITRGKNGKALAEADTSTFIICHGEEMYPPVSSPKFYNLVMRWIVDFCNEEHDSTESKLIDMISADKQLLEEMQTEWRIRVLQLKPHRVQGVSSRGVSLVAESVRSDTFMDKISISVTNMKTGVVRVVPLKYFRLHEVAYKSGAVATYLKGINVKPNEDTENLTLSDVRNRRGMTHIIRESRLSSEVKE